MIWKRGAVLDEEVAAQAAPEEVARAVAGDGARPHDRDQRDDVDLALAGDDAAEHHRRLARRDQADERAGLQERQDADEQVGPGAERLPDVDQQLVEVRQLDDAAAVDAEQRRR